MVEKKFYSDVRFVKIENLKGRAKEVAETRGLTHGLALLRISIGSPPQYDIESIEGRDPLEVLKELGESEGITQKKLNDALEEAFEKEK